MKKRDQRNFVDTKINSSAFKMSRLEQMDKIDLVRWYFELNRSITLVQRRWRSEKKVKTNPKRDTIMNLVSNFEKKGSIESNRPQKYVRNVRTSEKINEVSELIAEDSELSIRKGAAATSLSPSSYRRVLIDDLHLYPYKISVIQLLNDSSKEARILFATTMLDLIKSGSINAKNIWFSDEAHFYLNGYVNSQNFRIWGTENPHSFREKPLHPVYLSVWCAFSYKGVIGPFFFYRTMNHEIYLNILEQFFNSPLVDLENDYFQQDGAPPHRKKEVMQLLESKFGDHIIALNPAKEWIQWPPYSPDLTPLDYFLWGYTKDKIYKAKIDNLYDLKAKITEVIQNISFEIRANVIENFKKRLELCKSSKGEHFQVYL